jgi:hypothetical protein
MKKQKLEITSEALCKLEAFTYAPSETLKKIPQMVLARCEWGHSRFILQKWG